MANRTTPETQETKQSEDLVEVFIPKTSRNDNERFVAVNGERILIQTGKTVAVPRRFAEVIKNYMFIEEWSPSLFPNRKKGG